MSEQLDSLPAHLVVPVDDGAVDDGAADHLLGSEVPSIPLASTLGGELDLADATAGLAVVYVYPGPVSRGSRCLKAGTKSRVPVGALRRAVPFVITFATSPSMRLR